MKAERPSNPATRKLIGFFKVPRAKDGSKAMGAFINSIVDEMERVEKEEAAERAAKRSSKKRRQMP